MFPLIRKILLRVMLWCLALGAAAGVFAVFASGQDTVWRVVGTSVCAAIAAGLLLRAVIFAEKPETQASGLLAAALIVVEFLLALIAIWDVLVLFGAGHSATEMAAGTIAWVFVCGAPAVVLLRALHFPSARVAIYIGLAGCIAAFFATMIGTWVPVNSLWEEHCFETAGVFGVCGLIIAGALAGLAPGPRRYLRLVAIIAAAVAAALTLAHIWLDTRGPAYVLYLFGGIAFAIAHANLAFLCPLTPAQNWTRITAVVFVVIAAGLVVAYTALLGPTSYPVPPTADAVGRLAGAAGIIGACASLALLVLARINRKIERVPVLRDFKELTLVCPGCQKKQTLNVADARCVECGLRFHIRVEEPRCPTCNYSLYMLQSDRCPECGTSVGSTPPPPPVEPAPAT